MSVTYNVWKKKKYTKKSKALLTHVNVQTYFALDKLSIAHLRHLKLLKEREGKVNDSNYTP